MCMECDQDLPDVGSDVDLVVLVNEHDLGILTQECDDDDGTQYDDGSRSLRFGRLNLICLLKDKQFEEWKIATRALQQIASLRESGVVSREEAVVLMDRVMDPILNRCDYSLEWIKYTARRRLAAMKEK